MTDLPNGWQYKTLGEVAKWGSGGTPRAGTKSFYDGDIPWAIIGDLNDSYVTQTARTITQKGLDESSAKMVPVGAVLIAMYGSIGKLGMNTIPMATNQAIAFAIPKTELVLQKYLFNYLSSQREIFLWSGKGATQQNISQTLLKAWKIPLPPLPEQQKIVEILEDHLSRLDAALADVKQAKLKAAQFRRSLLQAAFTGNLTGDGIRLMTKLPDGWEIYRLEDLCEPGKQAIVDGPFGSNLKRNDYVESGIPVLKIQNVKENVITLKKMDYVKPEKYQELVRHSFTEGDIVMTKLGDPLGVSAIVNGIPNGLIVADLVRIRPTKVLTKFLCYQLNSPRIQKYINEQQKGTTRPRVNLSMIRELPIYAPPIDEQHKIVELLEDHLSRLDASVAIADAMEKQSSSLRRSLLQAAFTGQLTKEVASV